MGQTFGSGATTVSGSVTTTISALNMAPIAANYTNLQQVSKGSGAGATAYTVPASKIAILTSAWASGIIAGAAARAICIKGGVTIYLATSESTALSSATWSGQLKLTTGDTISLTQCSGVTYYEIDA